MDAITIQIVSAVAILGFMWKLHQEVSDLHKDNAALHKGMANLRQEFGRDIADLGGPHGLLFFHSAAGPSRWWSLPAPHSGSMS